MECYGAIDQGTTSSRFIVFDNSGNIVEQHQEESFVVIEGFRGSKQIGVQRAQLG